MTKAILLVVLAARPAFSQEVWDARLTAVSGDVTVYAKGEDPEGLAAKKDMPLEDGDRIRTGQDSTAEISFEGNSVMSLRSNSDFTLESSRRSDSALRLVLGGLLAKIQGLAGGGLSVKTPTAIAAVRGTEFAVEIPAENAEETHVGVFDEGKVEVQGEGGAQTIVANQETKVAKGQPPTTPSMLTRFAKYRAQVRGMRKRAQTLRKNWKALSPDQRKAQRAKIVAKMKESKEKGRNTGERKDKKKEREAAEKRENKEKMEKRREKIRQGLHK